MKESLVTAFIAILTLWLLVGCAGSNFYNDRGEKIASFEGDMKNMKFRRLKDGTLEWSADEVSHSTATLAQGKAASDKLSSAGAAVAVSGITTLLK